MMISTRMPLVLVVLVALGLVLSTSPMASAAIIVVSEARGDTSFTTIPELSSSDLAQGIVPTANQGTSNDPLSILTDGNFATGYGPVFGNGITTGEYKVDLGSVQEIKQVNTYTSNQGNIRGQQYLSLYGNTSAADPGWDPSTWTLISDVDTRGTVGTNGYAGTSIQDNGGGALGSYRWLLWDVAPISANAGGENSTFQEFDVISTSPPLVDHIGESQFNSGNVLPSPIIAISGDLLETSVASVSGENASANVRNGTTGTASYNSQPDPASVWGQGTTTYDLDISTNRWGYDIDEIRLFSGWGDSRAGQSYQLLYSLVDDPDFISIGNVSSLFSNGSLLTRTYNSDGTSFLSGVDAIRLVQINSGNAGTGTVFREIDLLGTVTVPEPSTLVLAVFGLLGLSLYRRKRRR